MTDFCLYIQSSREGTNYCRLAEVSAREVDVASQLYRAAVALMPCGNELLYQELCDRGLEKEMSALLKACLSYEQLGSDRSG